MADIIIAVDNTGQVLDALNRQLNRGLAAVGEVMEGNAKEGAPVDIGRLMNSITYQVVDDDTSPEVQVGTNVEYAIYQEYGENYQHKTGGAHFLRNSVSNYISDYMSIIETALKA